MGGKLECNPVLHGSIIATAQLHQSSFSWSVGGHLKAALIGQGVPGVWHDGDLIGLQCLWGRFCSRSTGGYLRGTRLGCRARIPFATYPRPRKFGRPWVDQGLGSNPTLYTDVVGILVNTRVQGHGLANFGTEAPG